jgi:DNA mismatch repair protein MutL
MVLIIELQNDLKTIGFDLKEFGKNTVVLEGIPSYIPIGCESTILQDILREYQYNQQRIALEPRDNIAKSFACKAAIKAGAPLTEAEMRGLVRDLFKTSMPYVCPHGRPVAIQIPLNELDRRFMRTS